MGPDASKHPDPPNRASRDRVIPIFVHLTVGTTLSNVAGALGRTTPFRPGGMACRTTWLISRAT
jgi:hypothetical protein